MRAPPRPRLRLARPASDPGGSAAPFLVDGHPASVLTWTADEWAALAPADRPAEARACPNGVHVLLRIA